MRLITGYKGFIGSRLFKRFKNVIGIDIKDGLNLLTCDLPHSFENEPDVIYHLAAQTSVESSWHDPVHDMDNLRMTVRLVKEYPNTKIIYTNSAAAINPQSPYGFSKWACAEYLKRFHKNYVICTLPNVYGEGSKSVVDIFKGKKHVAVYGDGLQIRDYVHVDDIVEGLYKAQNWPVGDYSLGSGKGTTVLELAKGKEKTWLPPRKEARESVLSNTTPDWKPIIEL